MKTPVETLDRLLRRLPRWRILAIASCGVLLVAVVDYATGYDVSVSVFYLAPVAMASWYAGRRAAVGLATLGCISWFAADVAAGHPYVYVATAVWNVIVRFVFFVVNGLLVAALRDSLQRQSQLARSDALTGALGRRAFEERLEHDLDLARRNGNPLTLAFIDLDDFKRLNDTRGHVAGDRVLRETALALQRVTRRADTVARLGGDEFAVILPETSRHGAEEVIAKLSEELAPALQSVAANFTASIGVVTFEEVPSHMDDVIRAADALMYRAKRQGKNAAVFDVIQKA